MASRKLSINLLSQNSAGAEHIPNVVSHLSNYMKIKILDMHWTSILGLILILLGTAFSFFGNFFDDEKSQKQITKTIKEKNKTIDEIKSSNVKLIEQNGNLVNSTNEVSISNKNLINQNSEMLDKIGNYQETIEKRNRKIEFLQKELSNFKKYNYWATKGLYGLDITAGSNISITNDLSVRMEKILKKEKDGLVNVIINENNMSLIDEVIDKYPDFPFGYFAKYILLKELNNSEWKVYAKKTLKILNITTKIDQHSIVHDRVINIVKTHLKEI
jgi:hypothetical protein